jgi:serine/threonine protein kinase
MALPSGRKLGPYEIQSPLGAGGMGEVYRAKDTRLDRTVAIKILPTHLSDNPEFKQRFEREARTVSSLNHPYICHLYDVGSQDGTVRCPNHRPHQIHVHHVGDELARGTQEVSPATSRCRIGPGKFPLGG